jgi:hypothetical protein
VTSLTAVLAALKELPTMLKAGAPAARPGFRFSMLEGEIPRGALVEVSGVMGGGKTETVLRLLAENEGVRAAWVEENLTLYPVAFAQARVKLERTLFVDASHDSEVALWAAQQILRSGACEIVVLVAHNVGELSRRRLQLAAERAGTTVILMCDQPSSIGTWPLALQLQVTRLNGLPEVRILKRRGGGVATLEEVASLISSAASNNASCPEQPDESALALKVRARA